jgi:CheY-like chemotaxis protein
MWVCVIVMDQYMEEAGGVLVGTDVIQVIRQQYSSDETIIIGCSGNDLDAEFHESGADLVWKKPMPCNADIVRQLQSAMRRRKAEV